MRNARDFVDDYRRKGYPDDRIRIIASMRPEPLRSDALAILDAGGQTAVLPTIPPAAQAKAEPAAVVATPGDASGPAATAAAAPKEVESAARVPAPSSAPALDAEARKAIKQEAAAALSERDKVAAELKKSSADVARARAEVARLLTSNAELPALRQRAQQLQAAAAEKEAALTKERAEREAAVARAKELTATVEGQNRRLNELDALQHKLSGASEELEQLRTKSAQLKENVEARCGHITQLQTDLTQTHNEATLLREQIESNGSAIGQLQEKLSAREAELESLRSHFDREAADLKKRAEQEMWVIRRRLRRVYRMASLGGAVAACLLLVLGFSFFGQRRHVARLEAELGGASPSRSSIAANTFTQPLRSPRSLTAVQPHTPEQGVTPRSVATSLTLPTVSEPPHDDSTGPVAPVRPARQTEPAPVAPAPSAPAALNGGSRVITYTVKKNDTLSDISERFLNDRAKWPLIARENGIQNAKIRVGMELHITVPSSN